MNTQELTDLSPMPFGKHKGTPMQEVPASYLHWLWTECGKKNDATCPVAFYIRCSLNALKEEYPDGVWS
jgi:hypothetical protein